MQIVKYPHPALAHKSRPLLKVDPELKKIVDQMFELMYKDRGVGLAANQIALPYRLVTLNLKADPDAKDEEHVFINPIISNRSGMGEAEEGCLSVPDVYAAVRRSEKVKVTAYNLSGEQLVLELTGLYARVIQHEVDHLDGVLFIDRLMTDKKLEIKPTLNEHIRRFEEDQKRDVIPSNEEMVTQMEAFERLRT